MLSRSTSRFRNPRAHQGGWITAALSIGSMLFGRKDKKDTARRADQDRARELALEERGLEISERQDSRAQELFDQYQEVYAPAERELISEAFDNELSPDRAEAAAVKDVRSATAGARGRAERNLRRLGVNPASGAYADIEREMQMDEAALEVGARTDARARTRDENFSRKSSVVGLGRGLPTQAGSLASSAMYGVSGAAGRAGARTAASEDMAFSAARDYGASIVDAGAEIYDLVKANTGRATKSTSKGDKAFYG